MDRNESSAQRETAEGVLERARALLIDAAICAYEDAGLAGLCSEGRWEAAVGAMRELSLPDDGPPRYREGSSQA